MRIVYDGTKGRINRVVCTPPFSLPTGWTLVGLIEIGTYQLDMGIGEMFLNFSLHPSAWKFCGANFLEFKGIRFPKEGDHVVYATLWMGFSPSYANTIRHLSLAQEIAKRRSP